MFNPFQQITQHLKAVYNYYSDETDGCELDFASEPTADEDVDGIVMFADIDPKDTPSVNQRARELRELDTGESL